MNLSFDEWFEVTYIDFHNQKWQRYGQYLWNSLFYQKPELANEVVKNERIDPFVFDSRVGIFLEFVQENWDKFPNRQEVNKD